MIISGFGAMAVVVAYWGIWYAVRPSRRKSMAGKDNGLKLLWRANALLLALSGASFLGAAMLSGNASGQGVAIATTICVLGVLGLSSVKRTARVKAAEVAAASPSNYKGYTVQTESVPVVPSFAEKMNRAKAESIIAEIKGITV
jgi:hypothetical protein